MDANDSAFPKPMQSTKGMTKREWIAVEVLKALIEGKRDSGNYAADAVAFADELINQLNR